jgi:hypothetical protein
LIGAIRKKLGGRHRLDDGFALQLLTNMILSPCDIGL